MALLALLAGALGSCDGSQVVRPADNGVLWTRLTSTGIQNAIYPDVLADSMVFTAIGRDLGFGFWDRLAFSLAEDGAGAVVTGFLGASPWTDYRPRWVRSAMIVYESNRGGDFDIYYRDVDTFDDHRLFTSPLNETAPAPRPNAPGLAYVEYDNNASTAGSANLRGRVVLIPDTAAVPLERIYLTPDTLRCGEPAWDPTGQRLAFSVENSADFTRHLYTMSLAPGDSLPVQITTGASHDFSPRWSADGNRILFASDRTGRWGLWLVHPSGEANGLQLISFDDRGGVVLTPAWTSDGLGIIASSNGRGGVRSLWLLSNLPVFDF